MKTLLKILITTSATVVITILGVLLTVMAMHGVIHPVAGWTLLMYNGVMVGICVALIWDLA